MLPSYCRVTGNSRNLPKPNYFPLLPPISPAEAKRICRLTGKSQSLEEHHYVPVIEFGQESRAVQCHITQNSSGNENHHFSPLETGREHPHGTELCRITAKHIINAGYAYVFPLLDASKSNKEVEYFKNVLKKMREVSTLPKDQRFVYSLLEDSVNLVLPVEMEEAVRRGEIESLMLSKDGSKTLLRLRQGRSVCLPMRQLSQEELLANKTDDLYTGAGQDSEVLAKQRKVRAYKKRKTSDSFLGCRRKFFEDRDKENVVRPKLVKKPKLKDVKETSFAEEEDQQVINADWPSRMAHLGACQRSATNLLVIGTDWRDLVYPKAENFDWDSYPKLEEVPESNEDFTVYNIKPLEVNLEELKPGPLQGKPVLTEDTVGFEAVPVYEPVQAFNANPPKDVTEAVCSLRRSTSVNMKELFGTSESLMFLPFIHEVATVSENIDSGKPGHMLLDKNGMHFREDKLPEGGFNDAVKGILLKLGDDERFIVGETITLAGKEVFMPGQNIATQEGMQFLTGITVQTPEGPGFIPGFIFSTSHGKRFVAGQIVETDNGREFVAGQAMQTLFGPKFVPGQTISTSEGLKFVAGHIRGKELIPGQVLTTMDGPKFIPGQTFDTPQGARFVAGQVYVNEKSCLDFVPGQTLNGGEGSNFVPGQTIETPDGPIFIPGQNLKTGSGVKFIPGAQIRQPNGQHGFVPGETMITNEGRQFVAGRIVSTENGPKFVPGKLQQVDDFDYKFAIATAEEEVYVAPGLDEGLPIDNSTFTAIPWEKPDLGYMVQREENVHFMSTEQNQDALDKEKFVSGQLLKTEESPKFVPGKIIETAIGSRFIPGQIVKTNRGEQFVPGQVVETKYGPKFVPGQVVETKDGKKFVPGQVFEGKKGPRFVPGQILHTKYGPTFIPGQVVYTDEGSRFVPGHVVETSAGPRFVPGQVVDLGHAVRFVSGQIIETENGPCYVAPDVDESNEEFSVQGFEVTPEELRLITAYPFAALHYPLTDEPIIDSRMLHQMAAAGVAVNRHTSGRLYDLKIFDPTDTDESILGANAFRMVDPLATTKKPKKKKEGAESGKQDPQASAASGLPNHTTTGEGNCAAGNQASVTDPEDAAHNDSLSISPKGEGEGMGADEEHAEGDARINAAGKQTGDQSVSSQANSVFAEHSTQGTSKNSGGKSLNGQNVSINGEEADAHGQSRSQNENSGKPQQSNGSFAGQQDYGEHTEPAGKSTEEIFSRDAADGKQTSRALHKNNFDGCENDSSSTVDSNYVSKDNSSSENKLNSDVRKDKELLPTGSLTPDNSLNQLGTANHNGGNQMAPGSSANTSCDTSLLSKYLFGGENSPTVDGSKTSSAGNFSSGASNANASNGIDDRISNPNGSSQSHAIDEHHSNLSGSSQNQSYSGTDGILASSALNENGESRGWNATVVSDPAALNQHLNGNTGATECGTSVQSTGKSGAGSGLASAKSLCNKVEGNDTGSHETLAQNKSQLESSGGSNNANVNTVAQTSVRDSRKNKLDAGNESSGNVNSNFSAPQLAGDVDFITMGDGNAVNNLGDHLQNSTQTPEDIAYKQLSADKTNNRKSDSAVDSSNASKKGETDETGNNQQTYGRNSVSLNPSPSSTLADDSAILSQQNCSTFREELDVSHNSDADGGPADCRVFNNVIDTVITSNDDGNKGQEFRSEGHTVGRSAFVKPTFGPSDKTQTGGLQTSQKDALNANDSHSVHTNHQNQKNGSLNQTSDDLQTDKLSPNVKADANLKGETSDKKGPSPGQGSLNPQQNSAQANDQSKKGAQGAENNSELRKESANVIKDGLGNNGEQKTLSQIYGMGTGPTSLQNEEQGQSFSGAAETKERNASKKTLEGNLTEKGHNQDQNQNLTDDERAVREKKAQIKLLSKLLGKDAPADDEQLHSVWDMEDTDNSTEKVKFGEEQREEDAADENQIDVQLDQFFKQIKTDLDSVENDPNIRDTLAEAEGWAAALGRPDLAEKVRNLMDILKTTENDPEVAGIIKEVLVLKQLAAGDKEAQLLLKQIKEDPSALKRSPERLHKYCETVSKHAKASRRKGKLKKTLAKQNKVFSQPTLSTLNKSQKANAKDSLEDDEVTENQAADHSTKASDGSVQHESVPQNESLASTGKALSVKTDLESTRQNGGHIEEADAEGLSSVSKGKLQNGSAGITRGAETADVAQVPGQSSGKADPATGKDLQKDDIKTGTKNGKNGTEPSHASQTSDSADALSSCDGKADKSGSRGAVNHNTQEYQHPGSNDSAASRETNSATEGAICSAEVNGTRIGIKGITDEDMSQPQPEKKETPNINTNAKSAQGKISKDSLGGPGNGVTDYLPFGEQSIQEGRKRSVVNGRPTEAKGLEIDAQDGKINGSSLSQSKLQDPVSRGAKGEEQLDEMRRLGSSNGDFSSPSKELGESKASGPVTQRSNEKKNGQNSGAIFEQDMASEATSNQHEGKFQRDNPVSKNGSHESSTVGDDSIISKRPPINPRKISSRRSSLTRHSSGSEENIDTTADCPLPEVIQTAKDIPKEVIDVLRYSTDEAKKELYVNKILEALGCIPENDASSPELVEDDDFDDELKRNRSRMSSRKSSACIILKDFLQTIIPQSAARGVLIGDINYMVIDDDGVRYFESAGEFASRRSSRFDIRQSRRSRSGSIDEDPDSTSGPWPWADTAPRSRRSSVGELRRRLRLSEVVSPSPMRSRSGDRRARHSVASAPLSRSSSGILTPMSDRTRSRRQSFDVDHLESITEDSSRRALRQRKLGIVDAASAHAVSARLSPLEVRYRY